MATSPRPYKNNQIKNIESQDGFTRPKDMVRHTKIEGARKDRLKSWITFYRRNPHRFVETYFGIRLFPYQILMLWVLQRSNLAYIVASRASAKTFMIAIWALTLAVLYPGIKIVCSSRTLKQGALILSEKLTSLRDTYPNVAREIKSMTCNANTYEAIFNCGSTIKIVPSSESARGGRASYLIIEESRLVSKDILEQILKPFLYSRMPPYRLKSEYSNDPLLKEEGIISYITSAWYTAEPWFENVKSCIRRMVKGDETANFLAFDYLISIFHNIKTEEMVKNEMADNDTVNVQMEYYNIPSGASGKCYYKPTLFDRKLKQSFYPQREDTYGKHNSYGIKKIDGEIRFVTVDVATRANRANDNSIIGCIRAIPLIGKGNERHLVYMESHKGQHMGVQAKRIKEIFYDFDADFCVLDVSGPGIGVFDSLSEPTLCEDRGITYPSLGVVNEEYDFIKQEVREELRSNHTRGLNAAPVIFPISASQSSNSQMATSFRSSLQKKLWKFLIPDGEAEEFLIRTNKEFIANANDSAMNSWFLNPYVQTGLMIGEAINLDLTLLNGMLKLTEKSGCYKDRYTSVLYCNSVISYFDQYLLQENSNEDEESILMGITQIL